MVLALAVLAPPRAGYRLPRGRRPRPRRHPSPAQRPPGPVPPGLRRPPRGHRRRRSLRDDERHGRPHPLRRPRRGRPRRHGLLRHAPGLGPLRPPPPRPPDPDGPGPHLRRGPAPDRVPGLPARLRHGLHPAPVGPAVRLARRGRVHRLPARRPAHGAQGLGTPARRGCQHPAHRGFLRRRRDHRRHPAQSDVPLRHGQPGPVRGDQQARRRGGGGVRTGAPGTRDARFGGQDTARPRAGGGGTGRLRGRRGPAGAQAPGDGRGRRRTARRRGVAHPPVGPAPATPT